jgi:3-hydroxyacyl-CoA dehydrogenase/enoyl-CoA hydratase/3-hydroxybutyryl-CoA epimerase/enoyl-CoA isomerase
MSATTALNLGLVDGLIDREQLLPASLSLLKELGQNLDVTWARRQKKISPDTESVAVDAVEGFLKKQKNKETTSLILDYLVDQSALTFKEALEAERILFANLAKSHPAQALIGLFLVEHRAKSFTKREVANSKSPTQAAVIGAGIMGGGIAYQMASSGVKTNLKDVSQKALELGSQTAEGYLHKQVLRGSIDSKRVNEVMGLITPRLDWSGFDRAGVVVEAVVERFDIKSEVLRQAELEVPVETILTSNTSTISIDDLAKALSRPGNFCGMHFFNPVPLMPLVEVIRGSLTSDETVKSVVAFAASIGKQPIVVNDCPGFLVNRILFPYFNAFNILLNEGVDCIRIDKVMEDFGWPMGPARLADVIGLDTLVHADKVLQQGFPDRMLHTVPVVAEHLLANDLLGRKSGKGFYDYHTVDGSPVSVPLSQVASEYLQRIDGKASVTDQEIIDRLMAPMCMEAIRCVDEGIVSCVEDADLGAILGLGFPRFRGGPLRYVDQQGIKEFFNKVQKFCGLGPLYQPPAGLIERARNSENCYS